MSDEQEHPSRRPGPAGERAEPDATREFAPYADLGRGEFPRPGDPAPSDAGSGDAESGDAAPLAGPASTAPLPGTGTAGAPDSAAGPPDGTLVMPAVDDATGPRPVGPADDATSALPAARSGDGRADPAWSGRAEVRPRRSDAGDLTPTDWGAPDWGTPAPGESRGAWWMPIVVGIVVLILLAVLGVGVWLIVQAGKADDPGAPAVTPKIAPASVPPPSAATSAAPPTPPSTAATTDPVDVAIPALVGLSSAEARRALERVGLTYRLIYRPDEAPVETVIDSDPPEGRQVPADTRVTLVIAAPLPATPTAIPSSPATIGNGSGD